MGEGKAANGGFCLCHCFGRQPLRPIVLFRSLSTVSHLEEHRAPAFSGQDLKLDKLTQFVLDECDKCLDKLDMRKATKRLWGPPAVPPFELMCGLADGVAWRMTSGCADDLRGDSEEEAGPSPLKLGRGWGLAVCGKPVPQDTAGFRRTQPLGDWADVADLGGCRL